MPLLDEKRENIETLSTIPHCNLKTKDSHVSIFLMWIEFPCNSTPNHRMVRTDAEQTDAFRCNLWTGKSVLVSQSCRKKYQSVVAQLLSGAWLFVIPWTAAYQASLSFTTYQSLLKFPSIELVMPSNHLIIWCPLFLLSSIFPSIRVFSSEAALCIKWPSIGASSSASIWLA